MSEDIEHLRARIVALETALRSLLDASDDVPGADAHWGTRLAEARLTARTHLAETAALKADGNG